MMRRLLTLLLNFVKASLTLTLKLVKFTFILFCIFLLSCSLCSFGMYYFIIHQDNFLNINNLEDMEALEKFLDETLPAGMVTFEAVKLFVDVQELDCRFNARKDVQTYSGSMQCRTPVSDPAFYGQSYPGTVFEAMFRLVAVDPYVNIVFSFQEGILVGVQSSFHIIYL
jgi:hypothetical protein